MSAESDKLVIKALRIAIVSAWFMIVVQIVNVAINASRECPKCPSCNVPAEKPAP